MHTSLFHGSSFRAFLCLIDVYGANAKPQQGLPHEVTNITTAEPMYTAEPILEPPLDNDTLTAPEPWSHPWLCEAAPPSIPTIHSLIYPSPDATPIEVTAQSQIVTSFQPEMTWCVGPAIALSPVASAPFFNGTTSYTTVLDGTGRCETIYAPVETTVCATTLTGLASKVTITECEQEVTFSSECGFTLETPTPTLTNDSVLITPAPTVKRMFTYWLAPWQSLTAGETPSDVDVKICTVLDNGDLECERYQEIWEVVVVTKTSTSLRTFDFTATVTGPGTVYVETLQAYITDTIETLGLSTVLLLETEVEIESTSSARRESTEVGTVTVTPTTTVFVTQTVVRRPENGTVEVTAEPTTTVHLTSVITRTNTTTFRRPRLRPSAEMPELAPEDF